MATKPPSDRGYLRASFQQTPTTAKDVKVGKSAFLDVVISYKTSSLV
jgi:hypothetical protein